MTQEDTALQVAWEEWLAAHPDRSTAGPVYRPGFEAGWGARQQVIDSLTAERDEARRALTDCPCDYEVNSFDIGCPLHGVAAMRAEAAEAEVKRLREVLANREQRMEAALGALDALSEFDHRTLGYEGYGAVIAIRAALATPPSEGGQS